MQLFLIQREINVHIDTFYIVLEKSSSSARKNANEDKTAKNNSRGNKLIYSSLLMKRQIDNPSPGAVTGGNYSLALTREVNLDTLSSDSS